MAVRSYSVLGSKISCCCDGPAPSTCPRWLFGRRTAAVFLGAEDAAVAVIYFLPNYFSSHIQPVPGLGSFPHSVFAAGRTREKFLLLGKERSFSLSPSQCLRVD